MQRTVFIKILAILKLKILQAKATVEKFEPMETGGDGGEGHQERKRKGAAPVFLIGLSDMDLYAGETAAVGGSLAKSQILLPFTTS